MATFSEQLDKNVQTYFDSKYEIVEGKTVPDVDDLPLGPHGRLLDLTMLFIDIRESTRIVDGFRRLTAARMYKAFLSAVSQVARRQKGELRSFNGDGVLVVYHGDRMRSRAVQTALNLVWVCDNLIKPKMQKYFENNSELSDIEFDFGIGVDLGKVLVVRGGIRGENNNDLVWVGNATNYAVKLSSAGTLRFNLNTLMHAGPVVAGIPHPSALQDGLGELLFRGQHRSSSGIQISSPG